MASKICSKNKHSSSNNDTNVKHKLNQSKMSLKCKNCQSQQLHSKAWKIRHRTHLINLFYHAILGAPSLKPNKKQMIKVVREYFKNKKMNKYYYSSKFLNKCFTNSAILQSIITRFKDNKLDKKDNNSNERSCNEQRLILKIDPTQTKLLKVFNAADVLKKPYNLKNKFVILKRVDNKFLELKKYISNNLQGDISLTDKIKLVKDSEVILDNFQITALNINSFEKNDTASELFHKFINNLVIHKLTYKVINNPETTIVKQQVKMLFVIPNNKIELITFNLLNNENYVNDLLSQGGILLDDKIEVSLIGYPILANINYIVECETIEINNSVKIISSTSLVSNELSNELLINPKNFKYSSTVIENPNIKIIKRQVKILIIMPYNNVRLITLILSNEKCYVGDLLKQIGILLNGKTKVSIVDNYDALNVHYLVKYKSDKLIETNVPIIESSQNKPADEIIKPNVTIIESSQNSIADGRAKHDDPIVKSSLDNNTSVETNNPEPTVCDKCGLSSKKYICCKKNDKTNTTLILRESLSKIGTHTTLPGAIEIKTTNFNNFNQIKNIKRKLSVQNNLSVPIIESSQNKRAKHDDQIVKSSLDNNTSVETTNSEPTVCDKCGLSSKKCICCKKNKKANTTLILRESLLKIGTHTTLPGTIEIKTTNFNNFNQIKNIKRKLSVQNNLSVPMIESSQGKTTDETVKHDDQIVKSLLDNNTSVETNNSEPTVCDKCGLSSKNIFVVKKMTKLIQH